jgi:hypothetical protein
MEKFRDLKHFVGMRGKATHALPKEPGLKHLDNYNRFIIIDEDREGSRGYHYDRFYFNDKQLVQIDSITYVTSYLCFGSHGWLTLEPM